ncbi:MAG: hypothetical protein WB502_16405 [Thermoactinomyces sp.]
MKKWKGYLCEHCGQKKAKYEARSVIKGTNHLICEECFRKLIISSSVIHAQTEVNHFAEKTV